MPLSIATREGYEHDFNHFTDWFQHDWKTATPEDIVAYLNHCRDQQWYTRHTLDRRKSAIRHHFQEANIPPPTATRLVMEWFEDLNNVKPPKPKKRPLTIRDMTQLVKAIPNDLKGRRDKALLLVGWCAQLERGALASLHVSDVQPRNGHGWLVIVRSSSHRQAGRRIEGGRFRDPLDLWRTTAEWLDAADLADGHLFRHVDRHGNVRKGHLSPQSVSLIVKERVADHLGYEPRDYSARTLTHGPGAVD